MYHIFKEEESLVESFPPSRYAEAVNAAKYYAELSGVAFYLYFNTNLIKVLQPK